MPDFEEGLIDLSWDSDTQEFSNTANTVDIGEAYYNLDPSANTGSSMFWYDILQSYLPNESGTQYESLYHYNEFMNNYSQYLPDNYQLGTSRLERGNRLSQQGKNILHNESVNAASSERFKGGSSGFASSGMQNQIGSDIWSNYTNAAIARNMNQEEMQEGVYSEMGQSVLNQMANMSEDGYFTNEDSDFNAEAYNQLSDSEGLNTPESWNEYWETTEGNEWINTMQDFCSNPDNQGSESLN